MKSAGGFKDAGHSFDLPFLVKAGPMRKDFSQALKVAFETALDYLNNVDRKPVGPTASVAELRARICKDWNIEGIGATSVVNDLARDIEGGLNNSVSARFYAWVIGGSLPAALA